MSRDFRPDPLLYGLLEVGLRAGVFNFVGSSMHDVCPTMVVEWPLIGLCIKQTNLGSSVASFALSTPMTAASAMSGCVKSTLSSSAGGTWKPYQRC
jgi:hypothetical protein